VLPDLRDTAALERLADLVADRMAERAALPPALVDVDTVARYLGVERSYVYEHAVELGARRLGTGPKARLRFSLADVDERLSCSRSRGSSEPATRSVEPKRRGRRGRSLGTSVPLLPVKGSEVPISRGRAA
jgi:hypothetical protein